MQNSTDLCLYDYLYKMFKCLIVRLTVTNKYRKKITMHYILIQLINLCVLKIQSFRNMFMQVAQRSAKCFSSILRFEIDYMQID